MVDPRTDPGDHIDEASGLKTLSVDFDAPAINPTAPADVP